MARLRGFITRLDSERAGARPRGRIMAQLRGFITRAVLALVLALGMGAVTENRASAQFFGGYGMGYPGFGYGGWGYGSPWFGYGGYGYPWYGYGGWGYGGWGWGYPWYGYGTIGPYGLGFAAAMANPYGGLFLANPLALAYGFGFANPFFGFGLSPLGVQSALIERYALGNTGYRVPASPAGSQVPVQRFVVPRTVLPQANPGAANTR
jgi:hypothetical protein